MGENSPLRRVVSLLTVQGGYVFAALCTLAVLTDFVLGWLIIKKVPYTEIDWEAYMSEVGEDSGFLSGERDYMNMRGSTGPLVYPAGFVWIYSGLFYLTKLGTDIRLAQYLFLALYLVFVVTVFDIYRLSKRVPIWFVVLICLSKRIHSIFMLRLFNDCFAMLFLYLSMVLFIRNRWSLGCVFFSFGVSVKMNVLLFAPGLLVLLLKRFSIVKTIMHLAICAIVQVILALPFLATYPISYFRRAFNFGKQFEFKWSVNMQFLSEDAFLSAPLAILCLVSHLALLWFASQQLWCREENGVVNVVHNSIRRSFQGQTPTSEKNSISDDSTNLSAAHITYVMLTSNFIGIVCAKSLHYQFYVWYFHSVPFLLWHSALPIPVRLVAGVLLEIAWNMYPPRLSMSVLMTCLHLIILASVFFNSAFVPHTRDAKYKRDRSVPSEGGSVATDSKLKKRRKQLKRL